MPANDYDVIADLYDAYVRVDFDLPFFEQEVARAHGPVLELMAGTGRVSERIASRTPRLTCIDRSRAMLHLLRRKTAGLDRSPVAICADICALPLKGRYALALLPFNSFAEITDPSEQARALREINRVLNVKGRLVCTLHNAAIRERSLTGENVRLGTFDLPSGDGTVEVWARGTWERDTRIAQSAQTYCIRDATGAVSGQRVQVVRFSLVSHRGFGEAAAAAGFATLDVYGDYERSPFDSQRSPYMIWILEKAAASSGG